jgi:hypothetical protein
MKGGYKAPSIFLTSKMACLLFLEPQPQYLANKKQLVYYAMPFQGIASSHKNFCAAILLPQTHMIYIVLHSKHNM